MSKTYIAFEKYSNRLISKKFSLSPLPCLYRFLQFFQVFSYVAAEKEKAEKKMDKWLNEWMETNCYAFFSVIQLGTFRSPEGEYFVEPLHSYQGEHYEEEHTKPHVVYRKSAPKKQTSGENSACDTSGMLHSMMSMPACNLHDKVSQIYTLI